jgi:hypothetical protein
MRPLFKVAHDKAWVGLTSTFTSRGSQHSQNRKSDSHLSLRNKSSGLTNNDSGKFGSEDGTNANTMSTYQEKQGESASAGVSPRMDV